MGRGCWVDVHSISWFMMLTGLECLLESFESMVYTKYGFASTSTFWRYEARPPILDENDVMFGSFANITCCYGSAFRKVGLIHVRSGT